MASLWWEKARAEMLLDPEVVNLNTGSFGPQPRCVFDQVTELRRQLAAKPVDFLMRQSPPLLWESRQQLADYLGTIPQRLVYVTNVTAAINLVASSLQLCTPGELLLSDHEYGAMQWCWERFALRHGLSIRTFPVPMLPVDQQEVVDAATAAMTDRTRLLFFSHVLCTTGMILPAKELCEAARQRGIVSVIDGAHAPGYVPLNLHEIPCDFYGANCHKWMLAPTGTGFLYVGPKNEDCLRPLKVSWGWRREESGWRGLTDPDAPPLDADDPDAFGSTSRIRFLEFEGTRDPSAWLTVPTAINFQQDLGLEKIRSRIRELTSYLRDRLSGFGGLDCVTPTKAELSGAMTTFRLPGDVSAHQVQQRLWEEHRIEVLIGERPEGALLRVSTHFYNTTEEINQLASALELIL